MQRKDIEIRAKNLLTEYWNGKLPVNINKIVEDFKIVVKKDMLFDSSGIVSSDGNIVSCKINIMDSEEKHRYSIACAIGYMELNSENLMEVNFDVFKDFKDNEDEENVIWQSIIFAHYLLMPKEIVIKKVEEGKKENIIPSFSHLYYSKEFKVPELVIKLRFKELGIN